MMVVVALAQDEGDEVRADVTPGQIQQELRIR